MSVVSPKAAERLTLCFAMSPSENKVKFNTDKGAPAQRNSFVIIRHLSAAVK